MGNHRKEFAAALKYFLNNGITTAGHLAAKTNQTRQNVHKLKEGYGKEEKRRAIAAAMDYEYEDFLAIGRRAIECGDYIIHGERPPPGKTILDSRFGIERLEDLLNKVNELLGPQGPTQKGGSG